MDRRTPSAPAIRRHRLLGGVIAALVATMVLASPASARILGVSPPSASVAAGDAVTITITTDGTEPVVTPSAYPGNVGVSRGEPRDDGTVWPVTFTTVPTTVPGEYSFAISDVNGLWEEGPFVLTVTPPATTTTTAPTTTTTVAGPAEPEEPEPPTTTTIPTTTAPPETTTTSTTLVAPAEETTTATTSTTVPPTTTTVTLVPPGVEAQGPGGGLFAADRVPWVVIGLLVLVAGAVAAAVVVASSGRDLGMVVARWRLMRASAKRARLGPARSVAAWWRGRGNGLPPPD